MAAISALLTATPAIILMLTSAGIAIAQPDSLGDRFPYREFIDEIAAGAGLEPIHPPASFPDSVRELRVFIGFGTRFPQAFVRIRQAGADTTGTLYHWWPLQVQEGTSARAGWIVEAVTPATPPDWGALLRELDSIGIMQIPQQPDYEPGNDGTTLAVQFRYGDAYRGYSYWQPGEKKDDPAELLAGKITARLLGLFGP